MRNKIKLLSLGLVVVFIFSFTGCNTPKTAPETTAPETTITKTAPETTARVTETTDNTELKESTYIAESLILNGMIVAAMEKASKVSNSFVNREITMAEQKILVGQGIKDTNEYYDFYLNLKPPDKFKSAYEQISEAMKHYLNSSIYMQQYIDTDNMDDMVTYIKNATAEIKLGNAYVDKATEEIYKLVPE